MSLKLSFNSEIHKIGKLPANYKALVAAIKDSYSNLPKNFSLYYVDSDEDCIMLTNDSDFNCLVSSIKEGATKSVPKIFIIESELEEVQISRASSHEVVDKESIKNLLEKEPIVEIKPIEEIIVKPEPTVEVPVDTEVEINPYLPVNTQVNSIRKNLIEAHEPEVHDLIADVVYANIPEIAMLVKDFLAVDSKPKVEVSQPKVEVRKVEKKEEKAIHDNIICDGCSVTPIVGIRYQCSVLKNFDLCEKCEAIVDHPYPLLKLKKPKVEDGKCSVFRFLDLKSEGNCSTIYFEGTGVAEKKVEVPVVEIVEKKVEQPVEKKEVVVEKKEEKIYSEKVKKLYEQLKQIFSELQIEKVDEFYQVDKNITFEDILDNLLN